MIRNEQYKQLVEQLDRRLQEVRQANSALGEDLASVQEALAAFVAYSAPSTDTPLTYHTPHTGLVNGRQLKDEDLENLNEEDYDVILDMRVCSLRYRRDPRCHSNLVVSDLDGIYKHRLTVLERMLSRPGGHFSTDTVYAPLGERRSDAAFRQTISKLRKALGTSGQANPYILTLPASCHCARPSTCVYTVDPAWRYLVVKG